MAKLPPIQGIMSELKRHCEDQSVMKRILSQENDLVEKLMLGDFIGSYGILIAKFCELLDIVEIPKDQLEEVLAGLKNLPSRHCKIADTIEKLSQPQS